MVVKAYLGQRQSGPDERGDERRELLLEASGQIAGGLEANVTIHNISAAGLLLETDLPLATGETLTIELPEIGSVDATIVWASEHLFGCAFQETLTPAALAAAELRSNAPVFDLQTPSTRGYAEPFGVRLNRLRRERGFTLAQVASALDVSKPTVWAWEKGKAKPLPERLDAIAEALGVTPTELGEAGVSGEGNAVVEECRIRIATAYGTQPQNIRIMIEV